VQEAVGARGLVRDESSETVGPPQVNRSRPAQGKEKKEEPALPLCLGVHQLETRFSHPWSRPIQSAKKEGEAHELRPTAAQPSLPLPAVLREEGEVLAPVGWAPAAIG